MTEADGQFRKELNDDERVLWIGKPGILPLFAWNDLFFIPFAIFFVTMGLGPITWELSHGFKLEPFFWPTSVVFILFFFIGLYGLFGRFVLKVLTRRHTSYAVTNKRILVLRTFPRKGLVSGYLDKITAMSKDIYRNGRGTITFGNGSAWQGSMGDPDPFGFLGLSGPLVLAFLNVKDVEKVYTLIDSAKRAAPG